MLKHPLHNECNLPAPQKPATQQTGTLCCGIGFSLVVTDCAAAYAYDMFNRFQSVSSTVTLACCYLLRYAPRYVPCENWYSADFNAFRVTQHYFDALGRETNTIVRPAKVEGAAVDANFVYNKGWRTSETTVYPDGTSDYSVHTDIRGVVTVSKSCTYENRSEYQTEVFHPTNLVIPITTDRSISYRNGTSVTEREWADQWTHDTRFTEYNDSGYRIGIQVSESSDYPAITNSVTACDFLGRTVSTSTPLGVMSNHYDNASMRILMSTRTGQPPTYNLYNDLVEQIGTVTSGITNRTDVSYETIAGEVWRVSESLAGAMRSVIREQLTGLSDTLRRHTITTGPDNVATEVSAVWNESAQTLTETQASSLRATPGIRTSKYGRTISETSADGARNFFFDPYGRVFYTERKPSGSASWLSETWLGFNDFGDVAEHDTFIGGGSTYAITTHAFDAFGRTLTTTDALGNTVTHSYDALGQRIGSSGATYPVRNELDTQGRMKTLRTTRDGTDWDTTQWRYDPVTGLTTSKIYADDSSTSYTYTDDGKLARRTWARGPVTTYAYNEAGLLATTSYSDTTPDVSLTYDAFQRLSAASNEVAAYVYDNDTLGAVTNETAIIGTSMHDIARECDEFHRLTKLNVDSTAVHYGYNAENRLATVLNDVFTVDYAYTPDGWDAGYTIAMTNGTTLSRTLARDSYRRILVKAITNNVDGLPVTPLAYSYDLLNRVKKRNTATFDYNARSEVIAASILSNAYTYVYDNIGNHTTSSVDSVTTTYGANSLNQYISILRAPAPQREPSYDLDGNMVSYGAWSYTWDAENRLSAVYSNSTLIVSNAYDHASRRILKVTPTATHTFVYDGWNLAQETIAAASGLTTNRYIWGKDLSGTLQGAGGVGGLLAVSLNGAWYFPFYDNNGNVTAYADESGTLVAEYIYDAFGCTIASFGPMADVFPHRFSTTNTLTSRPVCTTTATGSSHRN